MRCPACQAENPAGKKFCGDCGTPLENRCPQCDADNPPQRFCGQCGATALAIAAQTGQPYFDADLHRLDGDLLLATGGADDEAAARYHRALAIAREQGARSFELRAATSLARLWRDQGKRGTPSEASAKAGEARDLLAPVYGWFTEGLATSDLIDAKTLLEDLG